MTRAAARIAAGLVLIVVGVAWITRVVEGRRALVDCDAAFVRGDRVEAIVFARLAAEARCPGCASSELGFARLEAIAKNLEAHGDDKTAVASWRAARAAALASAIYDTNPSWRQRADVEIARLEHRLDAAAAASAGAAAPAPAASEERLRAALAETAIPSGGLFAVLTAGGLLFAAGVARFLRARAFAALDFAIALVGGAVAALGALWF